MTKKLLEIRTILYNKEKLTVMKYFEKNEHSRTKSKNYFHMIHKRDIGVSTIRKLFATKQQISKRASSELDIFEGSKVPKIESLLLQWINTTTISRKFPLTQQFISLKAEYICIPGEQEKEGFLFLNGWFRGFKKRRGLKKYKTHGESGNIGLENYKEEIKNVKKVTGNYYIGQIYNFDETSLIYRLLYPKRYSTSG